MLAVVARCHGGMRGIMGRRAGEGGGEAARKRRGRGRGQEGGVHAREGRRAQRRLGCSACHTLMSPPPIDHTTINATWSVCSSSATLCSESQHSKYAHDVSSVHAPFACAGARAAPALIRARVRARVPCPRRPEPSPAARVPCSHSFQKVHRRRACSLLHVQVNRHAILSCIKHGNIILTLLCSAATHTLPFCFVTCHPSGRGKLER
jgi:hypothetical protein